MREENMAASDGINNMTGQILILTLVYSSY